MKKLLIGCSLALTATVLMVSCKGWFNTKNNNNNSSLQRGNRMNRIKTSSGLEYVILQEGSGISPTAGKEVTVHYTGWLDNNGEPGTKFDSSIDRGSPFSFNIGVSHVIQGWDEGVLSMKVGEKRRLFIPSALGYGARGAGRSIPPYANLIFDVELLKVS